MHAFRYYLMLALGRFKCKAPVVTSFSQGKVPTHDAKYTNSESFLTVEWDFYLDTMEERFL
jgi:hypothetical protein